jgi:transglutaminase-like putative cysteine protease
MQYKLTHRTTYHYFEPVNSYHSLVCLKPLTGSTQICTNFVLDIQPNAAELVERTDFFGNTVHFFSVNVAHQSLSVVAQSHVETLTPTPINEASSLLCREVKALITNTDSLKIDLLQYLLPSPYIHWEGDDVQAFAHNCFDDEKPLYEAVKNLCHQIFTEFTFVSNHTDVNTPVKTFLKERKGVCQDFSHLAIACLRSLGFAARYVSGYLETLPPPGKKKLIGSDASHAWISVYIPPLGWCEFDPTNNIIPAQRHIITAYGRDYGDVTPLKGIIFSSGGHTLSVEVDVVGL